MTTNRYHPYRGHSALFYPVPSNLLPKRPMWLMPGHELLEFVLRVRSMLKLDFQELLWMFRRHV